MSSSEKLRTLGPYVLTAATTAVVVAASTALLLTQHSSSSSSGRTSSRPGSVNAIESPRSTLLPYLTAAERAELAYPPDMLPGARDVSTPFGTMRVNEWGPRHGRRVVFLHGDATPSPMWAHIANGLAKRGCRVMTFDLWGRGYSDTPLDAPHTSRTFALQVLFAASSSSVAWISPSNDSSSSNDDSGSAGGGNNNNSSGAGFSIVGFSLGGAIALDFAGTFPHLVNSVVLLAPAGLIRELPPGSGYDSVWLRGGRWACSDAFMRKLVARIHGIDTAEVTAAAKVMENVSKRRKLETIEGLHATKAGIIDDGDAATAAAAAAEEEEEAATNWTPPPVIDAAALVRFQFDYHHGHVKSFSETVVQGPVQDSDLIYSRAGEIIVGRSAKGKGTPLHGTKALVFLGAEDNVVEPSETMAQILAFIPPSHVEFVPLPGGHGFPIPNSDSIVEKLVRFWSLT